MAEVPYLGTCTLVVGILWMAGVWVPPATAAIATEAHKSHADLKVSLTIGPVGGAGRVETYPARADNAVQCDYMTPYRQGIEPVPAQVPVAPHALIRDHATDPSGSDSPADAVYFSIQY